MTTNILLSTARSYITLDLARNLKNAGHRVIVADTTWLDVTNFSNCIDKHYTYPSPRFNPEGFIERLIEIIQTEQIDLYIPIWEEIYVVAEHLHRLPCKVFCSSFASTIRLHNKWNYIQRLKELGIAIPRTYLITNEQELLALPRDTTYAVKACYSRASQNLYKLKPEDPLPPLTFEPGNPWIAQEWIEGVKHCSYSLCHGGKVRAHSTYPVGYSIDNNSCLVFTAVDHPAIEKWVSHFVELENWTGHLSFDFIQGEDGTLYTIECNPRATSGLHLFPFDQPLDQAFFGTSTSLIKPPVGYSQQILMGMLLYGWRSLKTRAEWKHFLYTLLNTPDIVFLRTDQKPFFAMPIVMANYLYWMCKYRIGLIPAYTYDIDWNGAPR